MADMNDAFERGIVKDIEMHEYLRFERVIDIPGLADAIGGYYTALLLRASSTMFGSIDQLKLRMTLTVGDETYTADCPAPLLRALDKLSETDGFTADLTCKGICGYFHLSSKEERDDGCVSLPNGQWDVDMLSEDCECEYGVGLPNYFWDGTGLFDTLEEIGDAAAFTYKLSGFYPNSGEFIFARIVDGVAETTEELLAHATTDILSVEAEGDQWWSVSVRLHADFDADAHPGVREQLHEVVRAFLPEDQYEYCEEGWEEEREDILVFDANWEVRSLRLVQDFLDALNRILLPIKDDVDAVGEEVWELRSRFGLATWNWYEDGFHVKGLLL